MTTAMFATDIDWVAGIQEWVVADELTGGVLSTLFPLAGIVGQPIASGRQVLLAGKGASDGTTSVVAIFDPGMLDESRLAASEGAAVAVKLSTGATAIGKKELLRDPVSGDASPDSYASAMDVVRGGSMMCAAGRPSVLSTFLPARIVEPINDASVVAVGIGARELADGRKAPIIRWFVPYQGLSPARQAAGAMAGAVAARSKELLGSLGSQPATANAIAVTQVEALMSLVVWADYPVQRGQPYGLHGRMNISTDVLAALWANRVQFSTARAAAEAYAVAHHSKKRALLLASLTPALRGSAEARVVDGGAASYVVEPALEAVDRAEYRVRIQRDTGDTVADLELRLRAAAGAWSVNWVGPYVARP